MSQKAKGEDNGFSWPQPEATSSERARMSCRLLGFLKPNTMSWSISVLVPELLYRVGHNSWIHSLTRGLVELNSMMQYKASLTMSSLGMYILFERICWHGVMLKRPIYRGILS